MDAIPRQIATFLVCFVSTFMVVFVVIAVMRWWAARPWLCTCEVCSAYLSSSWSEEFDNLCDWYTHLLRRSPTGTIHVHVLGNVITANIQNVEHMLRSRFDNYPKGKTFSSILGDLLGNGIFNVDGESWKFQRKMASLELGSQSVRSYAFRIVAQEIENRLIPLLDFVSGDNGSVLDVQDVFRRFSFDNICKISFGLDPGCLELSLPMSEFATAFDTASRLSAMRATSVSPWIWKVKRALNVGTERELKRAIRLVSVLAQEVIKQKRKTTGSDANHDLLSRFMGSIDDDKYLQDIVVSFLLAGRDTVASGITSFFFLLSKHPNVEATMVDEINSLIGQNSGHSPSFDQMRGLHYVHAALYEAMRLHPPVQFDSKFASADDFLPDGTFIKKGTRVTYHPYAMGRMEATWGVDCQEFRPERWLKDGFFAPVDPIKFPVFQAGLRVCLGKEMAVMQMKTVVVALVRRYRIQLANPNQKVKFASGLTASLLGGLPVRIHKRANS